MLGYQRYFFFGLMDLDYFMGKTNMIWTSQCFVKGVRSLDEAVPFLLAIRRLLGRFLKAAFSAFGAPWPCCGKRTIVPISA